MGSRKSDTKGITEYEPEAVEDNEDEEEGEDDNDEKSSKWQLISKVAYLHKKYKIFVTNLAIDWCWLHLSTDGEPQPLVIRGDSEEAGSNRTSVLIIISPTAEDDDEKEVVRLEY